ncbi:MAG: protease complex subunit PrcB family protein [Pyrinomonadaceae bacterium]
MICLKTGALVCLLSLTVNGAVASACAAKQPNVGQKNERAANGNAVEVTPTPAEKRGDEKEEGVSDDIKVLAEGSYGLVGEPFVAVVRDAESYAALRELVGELPEMKAEAFKTEVVVAAFSGTRRAGGYGVRITRERGGAVRVSETSPRKGMMTTQALTSPFKIVSLNVKGRPLAGVEVDEAWGDVMRRFRVKEGGFEARGGIAGTKETFALEGSMGTLRAGKLVTVAFDLKGAGESGARHLRSVATGVAEGEEKFTIPYLEGVSLVGAPSGGLEIKGRLSRKGDKLSLSFRSLPLHVSDSFSGSGELEAVASAPQ